MTDQPIKNYPRSCEQGILGNKQADSFPKTGPFLPTAMVLVPLPS